ncbi:hypothetical protein Egran_02528 [Elaphomyces granulatus]|uniref:Midasin n=1 Tax=Elaphomyces granulatus TaxID=519963 RepID=A0A232M079_9EURO|nr:hypothetical protein Egran_02528 [Elaphomyces granulatus]
MTDKPAYEAEFSQLNLLRRLPDELSQLISTASGLQFLRALALAALNPSCTDDVFAIYEPIFVDLAARWLSGDLQVDPVQGISAFSRILPFAPYLRPFACQYAAGQGGVFSTSAFMELKLLQLDDATARALLLSVFRLFSFDLEAFSIMISPLQLQSLFQHHNRSVRYLAVRCLCLYMHVADAATEKMVEVYVGGGSLEDEWEGITIDYKLLGLWEERRWQTLKDRLAWGPNLRVATSNKIKSLKEYFTTLTVEIGGVLLPRLRTDTTAVESDIVKTPTVWRNIRSIAKALLSPKPLLLVGLPNSGKTTLVNDVAGSLGQRSNMVTLHLNEHTDAKSLLGMYGSIAGSFAWQPGVLTRAATEGRWVLIEDLDRAPSEIIGLLLPIIEKGELLIPSRKERIKCSDGFRIIATMKSSLNNKGEEVFPGATLLGNRLWQKIQVDPLTLEEIRDIIIAKFPLLSTRVPKLIDMYNRLCTAFHGIATVRGPQGRMPGFRDLIKLCNRLHRRLRRLGVITGFEPAPESLQDEIFLDAVDIFLSHLPDINLRNSLASVVAEALQLSPQRVQFCLHERIPSCSNQDTDVRLGREICKKKSVSRLKMARPETSSRFASTRAALKTMEQVAAAVQVAEPILLVGETGMGKTSVIQQLATVMRQKLVVVNLSQQSETSDLLGGFKPVNGRSLAIPMLDEFSRLFEQTFSARKNQKFLSSVAKCVTTSNWQRLINLFHEAIRMAEGLFRTTHVSDREGQDQPSKRRKLESPKYAVLRQRWETFATQLKDFEAHESKGNSKFAFAFVEGMIVKALRNGEWVLLDEINLASSDILENIAGLLRYGSEGQPSVLLSEAGEVERTYGHHDFRIFGAMNPATDAGKRNLTPGLRSRFTEFFMHSSDNEFDDLLNLVKTYLGDLVIGDPKVASDLANLYQGIKKLGMENRLTDGAGQRPHFSIRTFVRTLIYIIENVQVYGIRRATFEGFCMSFLTTLSPDSEKLVIPLIEKHLFGSAKNTGSLLSRIPRPPKDSNEYVKFKHYWMRKGPLESEEQQHYIITPFIEKNLKNLLRASSMRRFPILLQGPTSSGKTSMVEHLAKISGNKFVRINNHDHTDLQEYLGSYVSTNDGTLRYQEGILVEALRNGYWIVLDELNLAPSDVLEALNRLFDENRELFLPETQEVIHPHPNFMLFATQNPAGLYGGRKTLSRAFRNRFLELHFDDIPENELEYILKERSQIAPSFCTRIVSVYKKLSLLRQSTRLFEQKNSFATLRDLFRWALRRADNNEQLAVNGFMLLAERVRNPSERAAVKNVIEEVMRVRIDEDEIYSSSELEKHAPNSKCLSGGIVWTKAMRRLYILVSEAIENNEPVLLVGETGCGKTQLCQVVADIHGKDLFTMNAHVNLETGDLIGAQRPVRNRASVERQLFDDLRILFQDASELDEVLGLMSLEDLKARFSQANVEQMMAKSPELVNRVRVNIARSHALFEWSDGSLVSAMKSGQYFLLDEISLADDSVLERLNSVLEPHRTLLLAEKGPIDSLVVASDGFQFLATMNPGGDYGKRELSAALRNRLTEIWVPQLSDDDDILPILISKFKSPQESPPRAMLAFAKWFKASFHNSAASSVSIRDLLAWVDFINKFPPSDLMFALVHGAAMVYIDTLGANPAATLSVTSDSLGKDRDRCLEKLSLLFCVDASRIYYQPASIAVDDRCLCVGPFRLPMCANSAPDPQFVLDAPTTIANSIRIARGLQLSKPILLEGSPGVGKTTLVAALARTLGKPLTRINLSDQTDLTDLFGSDVPVEGGNVGQFAWRDAPFLRAMQCGNWVLLDEMNLASQSVLEGLNSCLDHRQQVYIAELDQVFKRHPDFVLFATQNPHHQGGGRKGLPASFVNRFTVVYVDSFNDSDLERICGNLFPGTPSEQICKLIGFINLLNSAIQRGQLGTVGGPWEINLRDMSRWLQLATQGDVHISLGHFLNTIIGQRFRTKEDRIFVSQLYEQVFAESPPDTYYYHDLTTSHFLVGFACMERNRVSQFFLDQKMKILPKDLSALESLIFCVQQGWPSVLVGSTGCGKTSVLRKIAAINGSRLIELALSADTDTIDLIGGFEQIDYKRQVSLLAADLASSLQSQITDALSNGGPSKETCDLIEVFRLSTRADISLDKLLLTVSQLCKMYPSSGLGKFLNRCNALAKMSADQKKVGFEWTEGVLIEALQRGHWVVLDNANLCNASVLDRLNSLMEPNGYLVLNEQRTEDGSARIIRPHSNFRLFLTMDPRYGELSRAMRNRSVEICFLPQKEDCDQSICPTYTCQSRLYRIRQIYQPLNLDECNIMPFEIFLDHLSVLDLKEHQTSLCRLLSGYSDKLIVEYLLPAIRRYSAIQENTSWSLLDIFPLRLNELISIDGSMIVEMDSQVQPICPLLSYANRNNLPIHPLVNEHLLSILTKDKDYSLVYLAGLQLEFRLQLYHLEQSLERAEVNAHNLKPSQMTQLERSLASMRIQALTKDPTKPVSFFLKDCIRVLQEFIQNFEVPTLQLLNAVPFLIDIVSFCWDIFKATHGKGVDEAEYQAYLQIGRKILSPAPDKESALKPLICYLHRSIIQFHSEWSLTSGISMQRIWCSWRPITCVKHSQLRCLMELEETVSEFMNVAFTTRVDLSQLSEVRNSLIEAQGFIVQDEFHVDALVMELKKLVREVVSVSKVTGLSQYPYFATIFETICQFHDLSSFWLQGGIKNQSLLSGILPLLAGRPAKPVDGSIIGSSIPSLLHRLSLFSGYEAKFAATPCWNGTFSLSLLGKLAKVGDISLSQLDLLEIERGFLLQAVASSTRVLATTQLQLLLRAQSMLCLEILEIHREFFEPGYFLLATCALRRIEENGAYNGPPVPQLLLIEYLPADHYFRGFVDSLSSCLHLFTNVTDCSDENRTGLLAMRLAVICLRLFVPDKAFDPSLELALRRRHRARRYLDVMKKDQAVSKFEFCFSGQTSNIRRKFLKEELQRLDSMPPPPPVTRPIKSQLTQLHGEFSNLIVSVLNRKPEKDEPATLQVYGNSLRDNIRQICDRLGQKNYRDYDDVTILVIRFLQLLDLGIALIMSDDKKSLHPELVRIVCERTPFLGGKPQPRSASVIEMRSTPEMRTDFQFHELSLLVVARSIDPSILSTTSGLQALRRIFESFHALWRAKLNDDQEREAKRSQPYRYRGSTGDSEEDDEEFHRLFPTYEGVTTDERTDFALIDQKSISLRLAQLHSDIFKTENIQGRLRSFITDSARLLGSIWTDMHSLISPIQPKDQLAGLILLLEDHLAESKQTQSRSYNFYTDRNIIEAKKLVALIFSIQSRFNQLLKAWPEHAVLQDVITFCKEILDFRYKEPVAKFLTKLEKLHSYVHEWQLVASQKYSAASLFEELTKLIINWRRLELSTWAKLLDIEDEKCEQDASSWWFVAYEALIAAPLRIAECGEDVSGHTREIICTLEKFMFSTTMGQYSHRLRLVENFRSLLVLYLQDLPTLSQLGIALNSFLEHYRPFESVVSKSLVEGRQSLEKEIKEQVQLASWKDTNITALRESARRIHHRLFKVIRKYRNLLAYPAESILKQGFPDILPETDQATNEKLALNVGSTAEALVMCRRHDQTWNTRAPRFRDPEATARNMFYVYSSSVPEFTVSEQLDSFIKDVVDTVEDFRSQTPQKLTEDTKDKVQHLKSLKRRFYAETLHKLYFMGVRRNISVTFQDEQATVCHVLATTPTLCSIPTTSFTGAKGADIYFHRFLDLLPRIRQASREYSEDLSPIEASRSAGSAEGLLLLSRRQKHALYNAILSITSFESTLLKMRNLWSGGPSSQLKIQPSKSEEVKYVKRVVAWLTPIIGLSITLIEVHSKFSGFDPSALLQELNSWSDRLCLLKVSLDNLPEFPEGIASHSRDITIEDTQKFLQGLKANFVRWRTDHPELSFLADQIIPWCESNEAIGTDAAWSDCNVSLDDFNEQTFRAVDKIFVALQQVGGFLKNLPSSTENKDWLSLTDSILSQSIKELHMPDISTSLDSILCKLQYLQTDRDTGLSVASAIVASVLPIAEQYHIICSDLINRFLLEHRGICKMSYVLAKSFVHVASVGFCSPSEASDETGNAGNLESGTGLGEGDGAEDISKDVGGDEDLSELAQQENTDEKTDDIENSETAVNMNGEELEGKYGTDQDEKGEDENEAEDGSGEDDDIDEEVGSVDGLDPSAVDEKLWDGVQKEEEKDTENKEGKGVPESDQRTSPNDDKKGQGQGNDSEGEGNEEDEEAPEEDVDAVRREEMDVAEPHMEDEEVLDLPEEIRLDGEENGTAESDTDEIMDDFSDIGPDLSGEESETKEDQNEKEESMSDAEAQNSQEEESPTQPEYRKESEEPEGSEVNESQNVTEKQDTVKTQDKGNDMTGESNEMTVGLGADQDVNEDGTSTNTNQPNGPKSTQTEQSTGGADDGPDQEISNAPSSDGNGDPQPSPQYQAFKKLGDVLEQWHRHRRDILEASKIDSQVQPKDADLAEADFEHLADEKDVADTQALGQASKEQTKALDFNKALESDRNSHDLLPDASHETEERLVDEKFPDEWLLHQMSTKSDAQDGTALSGDNMLSSDAMIKTVKTDDLDLDEIDSHLSAIHLSSTLPPRTPPEEARRLWSYYESITNDLSLSLTEQLRLILAPTQAAKLRGDYRTGKRLNIKRIIPYIASQYKRDKIWMRRSIPSKRNYQIMLAVDDSKSMLESGSGLLAFETLALITRSLSMLEVGDLCILSFGDENHVRVAHEFGKPFSTEAGVQVFQQFSYQQTGTDVRKLVVDSIALFREARSKRSTGNTELWQLELIISDGICEDHESIRQLVQQAQEERIMIVFIITGSSILDLTQASFEPDEASGTGEMKLKMKRYLEGFPFSYYLVVRNMRELPAVLSTALKQWFSEIADLTS